MTDAPQLPVINHKPTFAELFKKYRLASGFVTLNEFGNALADKNMIFENSFFSHWQTGTRTPRDRTLLLTIIAVFIEHKGISSLEEANFLLESCGQGYLSHTEIKELFPSSFLISSHERVQNIQNINILSEYYVSLLQQGGKGNLKYYPVIDQEYLAITQLIDELLKYKRYTQVLQIWDYFGQYLWDRGKWDMYDSYLKQIITICQILGEKKSYFNCLIDYIWLLYWQGRYDEAENDLDILSTMASEFLTSAPLLYYGYMIQVALLQVVEKKYVEAETNLQDALKFFKAENPHSDHHIKTILFLGQVYQEQEQFKKAEKLYLQALELSKHFANETEAKALYSLGKIYLQYQKIEKAEHFFLQALQIDEENKRRPGIALCSLGLALCHSSKDVKIMYLKQALRHFQSLKMAREESQCKRLIWEA